VTEITVSTKLPNSTEGVAGNICTYALSNDTYLVLLIKVLTSSTKQFTISGLSDKKVRPVLTQTQSYKGTTTFVP
jgi:hypothetical protein